MATDTPATNDRDVVDILTEEHKDMLNRVSDIKTSPNAELRRDTADTVIAEFMRHAVAEEMHVYPVMEEHLPDGAEEVEHDKEEHEELVKVMKRLEGVEADTDNFMELVEEFESQLRHHVKHEEEDQFSKLREHVPSKQLQDLGRKVQNAKELAPTRPHPNAPHSELFHKTVGPGVGMVDRLRDKLMGRNTN